MQDDVRKCASMNTVAATVASASYTESVLDLARTARSAGFACLVVQPFEHDPHLAHSVTSTRSVSQPAVLPLPLPEHQPLLPRSMWCSDSFTTSAKRPDGGNAGVAWYGWRRSHLYKMHLWAAVLAQGFDLLSVDLDWRFAGPSPLPAIHALRAGDGSQLDVIAWWDGPAEKLLNIGLVWVRSTPAALRLVQRVGNRTFAGWDQGLFNEELQFRDETLTCCHSGDLMGSWFNRSRLEHATSKDKGLMRRIRIEGAPTCAPQDRLPPAEAPPEASLFRWERSDAGHAPDEGWSPRSYNWLRTRRWGRCTGPFDNTCGRSDEAWAAWAGVGGRRKPVAINSRAPQRITARRVG